MMNPLPIPTPPSIPPGQITVTAVKIEPQVPEPTTPPPPTPAITSPPPTTIPTPTPATTATSKPKSVGVIYLAYGKKYLQEAVKSARSFKKFHPKIPISVHTNSSHQAKNYPRVFDRVVQVSSVKSGMKVAPYAKLNKIKAMASSPYEITLYLDCDTTIKKSIGELFKLGLRYDLCIANSPKLDKTTKPYRLESFVRPKAYNSGVIVYQQNERTAQLFQKWLKMCQQDPKIWTKSRGSFYDQPKLVTLLNRSDPGITFKVIPNTIYNARHTMIPRLKKQHLFGKVKIVHSHNH